MGVKFSNPTATGGGGGGTVTNVSSPNSDIGVSSGTTTPILTLNSATTATASKIVKRDTNGDIAGNVLGNAATVSTNANLTGDITSVGNATTLTNAPVIAKVLTGYTSGAGVISATDSILQAIQKLNGNDATNANLTGDVTSVGNATTIGSSKVTSAMIVDGAIVNADINASAAIDPTKIADGTVNATEFQYINSLTSNAQTQLDGKASKTIASWAAPTLVNSWTAGSVAVNYTKTDLGQVFFRGTATGGTTTDGTLLCTLPAGFRPSVPVRGPVINYDSGVVNLYHAFVTINTDGTMLLYKLGTNFILDLNGVTFFTV